MPGTPLSHYFCSYVYSVFQNILKNKRLHDMIFKEKADKYLKLYNDILTSDKFYYVVQDSYACESALLANFSGH